MASFEYTYAKNLSLNLAGIDIPVESAFAIDLSQVGRDLGHPLDGLLGYDFFHRFVVEINYNANVLRLYDPKVYRYTGPGVTVPIVMKGKLGTLPHIVVQLKVLGQQPVERTLLIDSGSADAIDDDLIASPLHQRSNSLVVSVSNEEEDPGGTH